jgi:hypothetical protein
MPAPTALLPLPQDGGLNITELEDDELLLDAPDMALSNPTANAPTGADNDTEMHIDEEGRPRFAPAKNIVRVASRQNILGLTASGWSYKSRNAQSPHPTAPHKPLKSILAPSFPPTSRSPQAAGANERQEQSS